MLTSVNGGTLKVFLCLCLPDAQTDEKISIRGIFQKKGPQLLLESLQLPNLINRLRQGRWETRKFWGLLSAFCFSWPPHLPIPFTHQTETFGDMGVNFQLGATPVGQFSVLGLHQICIWLLGTQGKHISSVALGTGSCRHVLSVISWSTSKWVQSFHGLLTGLQRVYRTHAWPAAGGMWRDRPV